MENQKLGRQTFQPGQPPVIIGYGSAAGNKESSGPLGRHFDHTCAPMLSDVNVFELLSDETIRIFEAVCDEQNPDDLFLAIDNGLVNREIILAKKPHFAAKNARIALGHLGVGGVICPKRGREHALAPFVRERCADAHEVVAAFDKDCRDRAREIREIIDHFGLIHERDAIVCQVGHENVPKRHGLAERVASRPLCAIAHRHVVLKKPQRCVAFGKNLVRDNLGIALDDVCRLIDLLLELNVRENAHAVADKQ